MHIFNFATTLSIPILQSLSPRSVTPTSQVRPPPPFPPVPPRHLRNAPAASYKPARRLAGRSPRTCPRINYRRAASAESVTPPEVPSNRRDFLLGRARRAYSRLPLAFPQEARAPFSPPSLISRAPHRARPPETDTRAPRSDRSRAAAV